METTVDIEIDPAAIVASLGRQARAAAHVLAGLSSANKARAQELARSRLASDSR